MTPTASCTADGHATIRRHAPEVLQRLTWNDAPKELGDLFVLHKNRHTARAAIFTYQLGWEVRPLVGSQLQVVQTQACRSQDEVLSAGEPWKVAMVEKGWS